MRAVLTFLPVVAVIGASPVRAADCSNANSSQVDLNTCSDQIYKKTDAKLNALYKRVLGRLKDNDKATKPLKAAQMAWVGFRDAECRFAASGSADGSAYPMILTGCLNDLTRARIDTLEVYLRCAEGDMSCPVPPP
jgi:uncharacterized protein YecT (DUF1311 family)